MSTFHGLEMAKQALFAQQSALYTTGNNIANANTEGYSRQRVNFETRSPYPSASRNRPQLPGQMGTGVKAGTIERVRNQYLDTQWRGQNTKASYWQAKSDALARMEALMNEPTESGLSSTMDKFWKSLQDLANNPENSGARSVVAQRGEALADAFNYLNHSLESIRSDLKNEMNVTVTNANSILTQINHINEQIKEIEPHGYLANDLYDERDRLIDQLSGIVNIKVSYTSSGEGSLKQAQGLATIELVNDSGQSLGITLLDGNDAENNHYFYFDGDTAPATVSIVDKMYENGDKPSEGVKLGTLPLDGVSQTGSLNALIHAYENDFPDMQGKLSDMRKAFVNEFNEVHKNGFDKNGEKGISFFLPDPDDGTGDLQVNPEILKNKDLIAASTADNSELDDDSKLTELNGDNALNLADVFKKTLTIGEEGTKTSVKDYFQSIIGDMGVKAQEANKQAKNTDILRGQVENQRMSVSSVSLDEEISNLIKFQQAYNAAARSMTAVDEMIDRIINNMGLVGR
ncbi:flagellar hook-associated protein FlgK [Virgibacillus sp. 179-BFC.A HS]|uniref:Flagellar hook-associated protein 1 n=1 Tax=Tigheibacillus jepli TaxID=3035914 RepID=A0ABU5CGU8_9BACI|nr:flagellar hook-associated protein FlgK [Virgibacillus sp. 179-BFC.A HS]MDY0405087.1 flagellar hook-associated protein FlgK [Virgibacillus sp. 179-BFC.A HS]